MTHELEGARHMKDVPTRRSCEVPRPKSTKTNRTILIVCCGCGEIELTFDPTRSIFVLLPELCNLLPELR
eukprot:17789-Eustigmatos_ZCMA.PRE.1